MRAALFALKRPAALCAAQPSRHTLEQLHFAAELTLPNLSPARRRALWVEPRWLGCAPRTLAPALQQRLALYAAVAQRDAAQMYERARALLDPKPAEGLSWARFLLLAGMVGAHASGRSDDAQNLWRDHGVALYQGASFPSYAVYAANWKR